MAFVEWTQENSVGISLFDNQHKQLFQYLNQIFDAMKLGKGNDVLTATLTNLAKYTVTHFAAEENLMTKYKYPGMTAHVKEHTKFVEKVEALIADHNAGKPVLSIEITQFVKNWIINHINVSDKAYTDFFVSNGEK